MTKEAIASDIKDLLPDQPNGINNDLEPGRERAVENKAEQIIRAETAKELTQMKIREKRRMEAEMRRQEAGIPPGRTAYAHEALRVQEEKMEALDALQQELDRDPSTLVPDLILRTQERQEQAIPSVAAPTIPASAPARVPVVTQAAAAALQTTTRADVARMLTSLNINLNLQLTKADTANLMACLLTCNESQLAALARNPKVPIFVKTYIKRLQDDAKHGVTTTVDHLWDKLFGKEGLLLEPSTPAAADPISMATTPGVIPGQPISREAYIILRDTLIK